MAVTAMAQSAPDILGADSFAEVGAPDRVRDEILVERAAEAAQGGIIDSGLESLTPTEFTYSSKLNMDNGGTVLEDVLNHPEKLAEVASNPELMARLEQDLDNVERTQSMLDRVLAGDLQLGDAGRTQLRAISLELGNLYNVPRQLVRSMTLWTQNERNGGADQLFDAEHNPNIPSTEEMTAELARHDSMRDIAGTSMDIYSQKDIDAALTEGPKAPEPVIEDPEIEMAGFSR